MEPAHLELGQMMFGNAVGRFNLGEHEGFVVDELRKLAALVERHLHPDMSIDTPFSGYMEDFKNDVFEIHPYWWGQCECQAENEDHREMSEEEYGPFWETHFPVCHVMMPNFRFGTIEIRWYKHAGRGMSLETDHEVSLAEWTEVFEKCRQSIG